MCANLSSHPLSYSSGFDVNFMDDVGQTLLNWAAAFGSYEMVWNCVCVFYTYFSKLLKLKLFTHPYMYIF